MPWKDRRQMAAIFLDRVRKLGSKEKAAAYMRKHGYTKGGKHPKKKAKKHGH